jgi:arginine deiminase
LKLLEEEQAEHDGALEKLNGFDEEVRKLEALLTKMDNYDIKQHEKFDFSKLRETKEIEQLERKLAKIDEEYVIDTAKNSHQPKKLSGLQKNKPIPPLPSKTKLTTKSTKTESYYIIRLMFDPKSPQEWSGRGWCERGKGIRYKNVETVKQSFRKLKQKWPDYPLKIFKK